MHTMTQNQTFLSLPVTAHPILVTVGVSKTLHVIWFKISLAS